MSAEDTLAAVAAAAAAASTADESEAVLDAPDDTPHLGSVVAATQEVGDEIVVRSWINDQVAAEVQRLRDQGSRVLPVPTKNMSIYRV